MLSKVGEFVLKFRPGRTRVGSRERLRAIVGAGLGIVVTALLARWWASSHGDMLWLAAPLGASAVLVFAVPASPLAQPWPVVGGNVLSALVGSACAMAIADPAWAGACAVALAIAVMFGLRCLHPPGGASALLVALSGAGFSFAVFPMLVDSILLVMMGVLYNSLTGRRYPHSQATPAPTPAAQGARFSNADLDAALAHYNQVLDVSRDDLQQLLHHAEAAAYQRNFGQLICSDIMSRQPVTAQFGMTLDEAWSLMRARRIKALPVIDRSRRVVGIVTVADFLEHAGMSRPEGVGERLLSMIRRDGVTHTDKPETVGQIMTRSVRVASHDRPVAELVPLFSDDGHHHIPIIDHDRRLVGIITQTDLVRALYRATTGSQPIPAQPRVSG
ncbi:HPP family protein [Caenimonas sp. SL110]|uniref:HPP family protein n=1 Tax=Caenimonas sp. SL110 TaxID=1450524 RepID=UPI0006538200|nr:HPP family protein [Caenimonas sp. SL110]